MKKIQILLILLSSAVRLSGQDLPKDLPRFTKIVVSPRIHVVLQKGDHESVRLTYSNVSPEKVNVKVNGNKLRIYLKHARITERQERVSGDWNSGSRSIYHDASVTAYITYRELKGIEVRGEQEFYCSDEINSDKLKIKAFGEAQLDLAGIHTRKLKASLYGENDLKIRSGETSHQVYRLFGENKIDTRGLRSSSASTRIYGEGHVKLSASREVIINAIGEPEILVEGTPHLSKGIIIGKADIRLR